MGKSLKEIRIKFNLGRSSVVHSSRLRAELCGLLGEVQPIGKTRWLLTGSPIEFWGKSSPFDSLLAVDIVSCPGDVIRIILWVLSNAQTKRREKKWSKILAELLGIPEAYAIVDILTPQTLYVLKESEEHDWYNPEWWEKDDG